MEVLNQLGPGLIERAYENALVIEFRARNIPCTQQPRFLIEYKGHVVAEHLPDLIANGNIVVDAKTVEGITDEHRAIMISYLRVTRCRLGLYLNFKRPKLDVVRIVL